MNEIEKLKARIKELENYLRFCEYLELGSRYADEVLLYIMC